MEDAGALVSWASSADELLQWSGPLFSHPLDREQLRAYAETAGDRRHLISGIALDGSGVTRGRRETIVAHAELNVLPEHRLGQIRRVAVAPERRGGGIGHRLVRWLVDFGFDELGLNRLELVVFSFNEPALRCYRSAGFREEGRAREARRGSDGYWDLVYMAQLASWEHEGETPPSRNRQHGVGSIETS